MALSLLFPSISTKLTVPAVRAGLVPRSALIQRLERFAECRLLLVSAPAGSGKTTLLSQWTHHSAWPVAWVSLHPTDNDPIRSWSSVAMALEKIEPEIASHLIPLISRPRPEQPEHLVAALANLASGTSDPFALVLDDYHCVEAEAIQSALPQLMDYLPDRMHVILSSRSDPPLPFARWRARRQLLELRAADLRFSTGGGGPPAADGTPGGFTAKRPPSCRRGQRDGPPACGSQRSHFASNACSMEHTRCRT